MKKLQTVLLVLGIAFMGGLFWKIGPGELGHELALIGWGLIPLMLGEGVAEMIHTIGWRHCLSGPLRSLPWWTLFRVRMAGYAINYLTPTAALGGEITKVTLLTSRNREPEAVSGVLIGKVTFALAHLLFVMLGAVLVLQFLPLPRPLWLAMLAGITLPAAGILTFLLLQKSGQLGGCVRWLAGRKWVGRPVQRAAAEVTVLDNALKCFYRDRRADFFRAIGWYLVGYSVGIVQTWFFFRLLHQPASWTVAAGTWFLGMWFDLLTFAVPMNLGTLEGTRIIALRAFGYTALAGLTYGFAFRLAQLLWCGFGLIAYALMVARKSSANPPQSPDPRNCFSPLSDDWRENQPGAPAGKET